METFGSICSICYKQEHKCLGHNKKLDKNRLFELEEILSEKADKLWKSKNKKKMQENNKKAEYYMQVSFFLNSYARNLDYLRNFNRFIVSPEFDIQKEYPELTEILEPLINERFRLK